MEAASALVGSLKKGFAKTINTSLQNKQTRLTADIQIANDLCSRTTLDACKAEMEKIVPHKLATDMDQRMELLKSTIQKIVSDSAKDLKRSIIGDIMGMIKKGRFTFTEANDMESTRTDSVPVEDDPVETDTFTTEKLTTHDARCTLDGRFVTT